MDDTRKGLGEGRGSFGYGSTGKKASNNRFESYGEPYGPGDVIGCYLVSSGWDFHMHVCTQSGMYMYVYVY